MAILFSILFSIKMDCPYCRQEREAEQRKEMEQRQREREQMEREREKERQQRCYATQQRADAVCQAGPNGDIGWRFSGGEALSQGLSCLTNQKIADNACKK